MNQITRTLQDRDTSITITYSVRISASEAAPEQSEQKKPKKQRPQYEVIRTTGIGFMPSSFTTASSSLK